MQEAMREAAAAVQQEFCTEVFPTLGCMAPLYQKFFADIDECVFLSDDTIEEMRVAAEPILNSYIDSLNEQGYDGQEAFDTFKGLCDKYADVYPAEGVIDEFKQYCDNVVVCD